MNKFFTGSNNNSDALQERDTPSLGGHNTHVLSIWGLKETTETILYITGVRLLNVPEIKTMSSVGLIVTLWEKAGMPRSFSMI